MIDRPLANDALGKKGERRFGELCDDADLIANIADHDRAGWDYVIDFRLPTDGKRLDARPAPITARVQVKTQWEDQSSVKLRLSSAEHLVKHNGPSFICVLSVNAALEFTGMRLVHCRGAVLEKVLKRLRRAEADNEKPNDVALYLNPALYSETLPVHHQALRASLEAVCSTDHLAYLQAKQTELSSLGFDTGFMDLKATFVGTEDDVVDAFLGLRPIDATNLSATQTRFGISLPFDGLPMTNGQVSIEPHAEKCDLFVRAGEETWAFKASLVRAPSLVVANAARPKFLIRTALFQITIVEDRLSATRTATFTMLEVEAGAKHRASAWADLYGVFGAITKNAVELSFKPRGQKLLRFPLKQDATSEYQGQWAALARLSIATDKVFTAAGAPNVRIGMQEIVDARSEIETAYGLMTSPDRITRLEFSTAPDIALPPGRPIDTLLGHAFAVGGQVVACGIRTVIRGTPTEDGGADWTSEAATFDGLQRVASRSAFERFVRGRRSAACILLSGVYSKGMDIFYSDPSPTLVDD